MLPDAPQEVAASRKRGRASFAAVQHFLHAYPTTIPFIVLLIGVVFFSWHRRRQVLRAVQSVADPAAGHHHRHRSASPRPWSILTAGIDLSVGAIMVLSSVVMGRSAVVYRRAAEHRLPARPRSSACSAAWSTGCSSRMLRLPPFIVTLGTWSIFGALNIFYSRSETIRQQDIEAVAPFLQFTGTIIKPYDLLLKARPGGVRG